MTLGYEEDQKNVEVDVNFKEEVVAILEELHPNKRPFIHLTRENRDYLQCAGGPDCLTVEVRFYDGGSDTFKHYVVGHREMSKVWVTIECRVGPINVLKHERLTIADACEIFIEFYNTGTIPEKYLKRNVTERFK